MSEPLKGKMMEQGFMMEAYVRTNNPDDIREVKFEYEEVKSAVEFLLQTLEKDLKEIEHKYPVGGAGILNSMRRVKEAFPDVVDEWTGDTIKRD